VESAFKAHKVLQVLQVQVEPAVFRVHKVLLAQVESAFKAHKVLQVQVEPAVFKALKVVEEPQAHKVLQVQVEPVVL